MQRRKSDHKVQTTLRLPRPLYEQAKVCVEKGMTAAETINDFIIAAIRVYTKILRRKRIDAAFNHMAEDANFQKEAQLIAEEFIQADWETFENLQESEEQANAAR